MKSIRSTSTAGVWFAVVLAGAIAAIGARAQSPQAGGRQHGMDHRHLQMGSAQAGPAAGARSDDARQLVSLPDPMRQHMLSNMRDHLATLDTVFADIAGSKFDEASKLLEQRLGMSSLPTHHAADMAPFFPKPMQEAGTSMHRAASKLSIALQNASVTQSFDSMQEVNAAVHEVTSSCVACHAGYRVR